MTTTKTVPMTREHLRTFLKGELERGDIYEPLTPGGTSLFTVLTEAIEGLDELDYGGYPEIFAQIPMKTKGRLPFKARMLEQKAVESVALLHAMGRKVGEAKETVAKCYGCSIDTMDQWRKAFPKKDSPKYPHHRVWVANS